jgi:hypothetical protein
MSTVVAAEPRIDHVRITKSEIVAYLCDGRVISVPLAWSWRLSEATPSQRSNYRLIGNGRGIHWPDVDEDLSVDGMLHGSPAPKPSSHRLKKRNDNRREVKAEGSANKAPQRTGKARR